MSIEPEKLPVHDEKQAALEWHIAETWMCTLLESPRANNRPELAKELNLDEVIDADWNSDEVNGPDEFHRDFTLCRTTKESIQYYTLTVRPSLKPDEPPTRYL